MKFSQREECREIPRRTRQSVLLSRGAASVVRDTPPPSAHVQFEECVVFPPGQGKCGTDLQYTTEYGRVVRQRT